MERVTLDRSRPASRSATSRPPSTTPFNVNGLWLGMGVTLAVQHAALLWRAPRVPLQAAAAPS